MSQLVRLLTKLSIHTTRYSANKLLPTTAAVVYDNVTYGWTTVTALCILSYEVCIEVSPGRCMYTSQLPFIWRERACVRLSNNF